MTTLLEVLTTADHGICEGGPCAAPTHHRHVATVLVEAIPSETREALDVGLLLAEVERRLENGLDWDAWRNHDAYVVEGLDLHGSPAKTGGGPTLHAALTALLEQLP